MLAQIGLMAVLLVGLAAVVVVRIDDAEPSHGAADSHHGGGGNTGNDAGGEAPSGPIEMDLPEDRIEDYTAQSEVVVEVVDNAFRPQFIKVKVGTVIRFENRGGADHDVTPDVTGVFEASPRLSPGDSFELTPSEPGDIGYYCSIHGIAGKNGKPGRIQAGALRVVA